MLQCNRWNAFNVFKSGESLTYLWLSHAVEGYYCNKITQSNEVDALMKTFYLPAYHGRI